MAVVPVEQQRGTVGPDAPLYFRLGAENGHTAWYEQNHPKASDHTDVIANYNASRYSPGDGLRSRKLPSDIQNAALRKLRLLNQARVLGDLRIPPGNRLEALRADRQGQHSIRINDPWRICFVRDEGGPSHVEIVDYHA